ncbi:Septation initiation network scaffold protein cdc11 [Fusarium austroafricanum]|uniref:Septation initiation network scaffold protein cdc11 n=1 Tax=Fusarium austroafricanum TaxID=2364996 RepID=A0A8H4KI56_9HYPO|nr:Septation initiation network scaffold protein cdc11 [Fusarium austroafricanum]
MDHAWLDSLSEDWVSQPRSDSSAVQLPPLKDTEEPKTKPRETPSRIPRRALGSRPQISSAVHDSSINILSERNANDINISSQRIVRPSSQGVKFPRGRFASRSVSASTTASVVHNTIQHKSSPGRQPDTPEWKRRLVYGDVGYGEQRDLFCSAATGLQDMFRPPEASGDFTGEESRQESSMMPSSPPSYPQRTDSNDLEPDLDQLDELDELEDQEPLYPNDVTPSPSPRRAQREIKYKLNEDTMVSSVPSPRDTETPSRQRDDGVYRDESYLSAPPDANDSVRKISGQSGQSVIRNEDFSPILIGKQSDKDGKMDFAPIELPADRLKSKLEALRINQMLLDPAVDPKTGFDDPNQDASGAPEDTEEYAAKGGFLNTQRGGRSGDGSFRYRDLSAGLGVDTSGMFPEESLQASTPKQFPSIRTEVTNPYQNDYFNLSPNLPRAPFPSPDKKQIAAGRSAPSAGSPLKLFGPYDTFTNQTLLRRISQFEEGMSGTPSRQSLGSHHEQSDIYDHDYDQTRSSPALPTGHKPLGGRSFSRFGAGDLEGYEFSEELSYVSQEDPAYSDKENNAPQSPDIQPVESVLQHPEQVSSPTHESQLLVSRRRNKSTSSSTSRPYSSSKSLSPAKGAPGNVNTPKRDSGSEGKRPRTSPSKDPTPKRRRTLHRSDIAFGREYQLEGVESASRDMQSIMGRKRKDARPSDLQQLANPSVLAMRNILRPRSPTPSRGSSHRSDPNMTLDSEDGTKHELPKKSPIRALQDEALGYLTDGYSEGDRKPSMPSIRTQDFVDQAAQIMAMIRNQVKPPGLSSVEESEAENGTPEAEDLEDSYQESTNEPLSRPPSREGNPVPRPPQHQENPELIKRLRKYQEFSDMGDIITLSMRSMGLVKEAILADKEVEREIENAPRHRSDLSHDTKEEVISDPPNIRLSAGPTHDGSQSSPSRDYYSHSSGASTNRTYRTTSSHASETRRTIMPESVSHLIPDRVGSMYLDKQNNIWIKKKETPTRQPMNILPSDSEDDPFASIPDLSVDLTREMQNLVLTTAKKNNATGSPTQAKSPISPSKSAKPRSVRGYTTLSPDAPLSPEMASLAREEFEKLDARVMEDYSELYLDQSLQDEGSFHDVHDDKADSTPSTTTKKRNLTITFSSPVASFIQDVVAEDLDNLEDDPELPNNHFNNTSSPKKSPGYPNVGKSALKNSGSGLGRHHRISSGSGPAFIPRPVSRIDEQDEESTIELPIDEERQVSIIGDTSVVSHKTPDGRRTSVSFLVNHTPSNSFFQVPRDDSVIIGQNVGKLSLSPLSEFTINNPDQSFGFEVSYVMGRRHAATGDGSKKVMSMTIRDLVDKLSEVEPYEPYWEDITELDLHEKRLGSLHMLDQFCGKLVTLDASKNALGHLDGVPTSVRQLKVSQNLLTELTSWDHLMNLQYVDISGNEVKSLSALRGLVHLRSIRADNNQLTSLDGLDTHDGLLSLRARDNLIEEVDFARVKMERLTELDLGGNRVSSVRNMEHAPALTRLRLSKNKLTSFVVPTCIKGLRLLELSDNQLTTLDVSNMPSLHSLHADRNRITGLSGFSRARKLDSLSLREQRADKALDLGFLSSAYEVRKLFLSGNYLGTFEPIVDFLNLQLLELANCGIQALPDNLGQLMPNLRTLNINFNAIRDLEPLRFIPRLKKLLVAGNRLADSTLVTELLIEFPHIIQLDLRDNPVTLGFYAPMQVLVPADREGYVDPFMLPDADVERDEQFSSRLDQMTKLRRRLHQIVFVASCKRLRKLDGLDIVRETVLAKDAVFETLVAEGLLPDETLVGEDSSPCKGVTTTGDETMGTMRSSRWNAEDSFA